MEPLEPRLVDGMIEIPLGRQWIILTPKQAETLGYRLTNLAKVAEIETMLESWPTG